MNKWMQTSGACMMLVLSSPVIVAEEVAKETSNAKMTTAELSVPPLDHVDYPISRPDWCNDKPDFTQRDHRIIVTAGPCDSGEQCDEHLKWMQRAAVASYANRLTNSFFESSFSAFLDRSVTDQDINDRYVSRRYRGPVTVGGETKHEKVVQLTFSPKIQEEIRQAARGMEVHRRLKALAVTGVLGVTLLMCSSGLLGLASRRVSRLEGMSSLD